LEEGAGKWCSECGQQGVMRVIFKDQNAAKVKIQYLLIRQKHLHIFGDLSFVEKQFFPIKVVLAVWF